MDSKQNELQPSAQAGWSREAGRVGGEVGVLHRSVDLWESTTHGEPREGTCSKAPKRSAGGGDGSRERTAPEKVRKLPLTLYRKAKAEPQYRFWSLYGEVLRRDVLQAALVAVAENDGAPGVDGESLETITATVQSREQWLEALREELHAKRYRPSPVRRVWIGKRNGGERPLGIPTVKDRVVQTAVYLVLMPIYEADFHDQSYGFRPKRRAHQAMEAMEAIRAAVKTGRVEVLDADLSKFFDLIPHRELLKEVARRVSDGSILALLKSWLRAPIVEESEEGRKKVTPNRQGKPQGGVICQRPPALPCGLPAAGYLAPLGSPLLANIYLNPLDHRINGSSGQRHRMVRYADDFVVLSPKGQSAQARREIEDWLDSRGLALNESKTRTADLTQESIRFLGFGLKVRRGRNGRQYTHVEASGESCRALREKVGRILNHRTHWRAIADVMGEVNAVLRGWSGYFHYGNSAGVFGRMRYWTSNCLRRWLWRKHGCRGGLYKHYTHDQLEERYGLWKLPRSAGWTTA